MGARVLVVDDSPTLRRVVTGILTRSGYDAVAAADGIAALEILGQAGEGPKFELVLLDFVMPRMTGYEFCRRIRADEKWKTLPVILMSAKAEKIRAQFVEQTGALDAISKPFDARGLLAVVENTLQKAEQKRAGKDDDHGPGAGDSTARSLGPESSPASTPDAAAFRFARDMAEVVSPLLDNLPASERGDAATRTLTRAIARALTPAHMTKLLDHLEEWSESAGPEEVLRGRSDAIPLGEMLQVLQMQMQTGRLVVARGEVEISVYFEKGLIDVAASRGVAPEFRLGRYLVEEGLLTNETLERVAQEAKAASRLLGDYVIDAELVSEEDVRRALIRQSSELIYEFLRWPRARFSFRRQLGESMAVGAKLGLPVASLVMEGFRRVDEWRLIEESIDFDGVLFRDAVAIERLGPDRLSRTEKLVLDLVDGERPVREVVAMSNASSFDACKILYQFLQSRLVRRRTA